MQVIVYGVFFATFACLMVMIKSRRKLVAVTVTAVMVTTLAGAQQPAQAQSGILSGIQAVLNVINGIIQSGLTSINTVRATLGNLEQVVIWPQQLINQAKAQVMQMIGQYRSLMTNIFHVNLKSATLPAPQAFEAVIRNHQVNDFSGLTATFGNTYGVIPAFTAANPTDRAMSDMDDALALDNLKLLKASDQATDVELQSADSVENAASQAAPRDGDQSIRFLSGDRTGTCVHGERIGVYTKRVFAAARKIGFSGPISIRCLKNTEVSMC